MLKAWQPKYSVTAFSHIYVMEGDHSQFVKYSSSCSWVSLPSQTVAGGTLCPTVSSHVDPARAFGMLHPAQHFPVQPSGHNAPSQQ